MNLAEAWLADASSLWLSLGALIIIALLVVLMFNAFQGRARQARASSTVSARKDAPAEHQDRSSSLPESLQGRVEPRFGVASSGSRAEHGSEDESDRASFAGASSEDEPVRQQQAFGGSAHAQGPQGRAMALTARESATGEPTFDERFPPEIQDEDPAPHSARISDPDADAAAVPDSVAKGVQANRTRPGVTARRQANAGAGLPLPAEWGGLDERIDCIALMELQPPVDCIALRSGAQTLARIGSKSVIAEVQLLDGSWCDVRAAEGQAGRLRLGILLANRQGPLSAAEFAEFAEKLRRLAGKLGVRDARLPETMGVLERARQVDEFCARLDTLIGVNVLAPSRIPPAQVAELAGVLELAPRGHQRYARPTESGDVLFTMLQAERPEMLTFLLDVPRAPSDEQPWTRMVEAAHRCATILQAQLVDDALAPLSDAAAQAVARQLQSHYSQLEGAGLNAGSPAALRVFN